MPTPPSGTTKVTPSPGASQSQHLDVGRQAAAREPVGDDDLHPMNEPRTLASARPATAPDSTSRAISSAA